MNDLLTPPQQTHIRPVVRVNGTGGISYRSHSDGVIQRGDISKVAERPALRFPRALEIFETLAQAAGLKIQESSAGQMARLALGHWPNIHALAMDLESIVTRPVLDAYVREFAASELCGNAIGGRRYMSFEDLRRTIDASSGHGVETEIVQSTSEIVDRLLSSSVLRRGFCLKCSQCRSFEFYDLEDVGQTFSCVRCRADNLITSQSGRGGSTEPAWYYELTEVVYQAHRQNFAVPVLAFERFTRAHESVLTMTEHRVRGSGIDIEIDLWAIVDGQIVIGEAKLAGRLEKTAKNEKDIVVRYRSVAEQLSADRVVFATAAHKWRDATKRVIEAGFEGSEVKVEFIELGFQEDPES